MLRAKRTAALGRLSDGQFSDCRSAAIRTTIKSGWPIVYFLAELL